MSWRILTPLLAFLSLLCPLFGAELARAQGVPVITGVFPPGATVGQTTEWTISGRNLAKVRSLVISGRGVEVVELSNPTETSVKARVKVAEDADLGVSEVRVDGPSGVSNLALVRIDRLQQVLEIEPNQTPTQAQTIGPGTAVAGVLKALDRDHFRIEAMPGSRLAIELEAQRLGTSIGPVVTILSATGTALVQGRESRGLDKDCRLWVAMPADGVCLVQVRDNTYGGGDQAHYRLRVDSLPYATGLFPVGGVRGETIEVEVSGGNLAQPLRKSLRLSETPGVLVEPGFVASPSGPVAIPGWIVVGDGPEIDEPPDRAEGALIEVKPGLVVNGRIGQPDEVDVYRIEVKAGDKVRARIEAAALGSWLDSVIVIRDSKGAILAENDDSEEPVRLNLAGTIKPIGLPQGAPDSAVEYEVKADGTLTIEVSDRFGEGGPEYPYRLVVGPERRTDLALTVLLGNTTGNAQLVANLGQGRITPGQFGVFNLKPGGAVPINFVITPEGRPGLVEVSVEGLPDGATADPVVIRFPGSKSPATARVDPVADFILVKVDSFAQPALSELRLIARARPSPGVEITREAWGVIGVDLTDVVDRPIRRLIRRFPFRIQGEVRPRFVGPPTPPKFLKINGLNPLLQGDRLDMTLEFAGVVNFDDGSTIEAKVEGGGLLAQTVIGSGSSTTDNRGPEVTVQVLASIAAEVGPHPLKVTYTRPGGLATTKELTIEVKVPIEVRPTAEAIYLGPGDRATFRVEIQRAAGFDGEVEIKLEGLPDGVKPPRSLEIGPGKSSLEIPLELSSEAKAIEMPVGLRVVGMARMPCGNVSVESQIRPMIQGRPADK